MELNEGMELFESYTTEYQSCWMLLLSWIRIKYWLIMCFVVHLSSSVLRCKCCIWPLHAIVSRQYCFYTTLPQRTSRFSEN